MFPGLIVYPEISHDLFFILRCISLCIFQTVPHMQVVILNYCRALQPKSLGLLVDHARDLHRLEIYGEESLTLCNKPGTRRNVFPSCHAAMPRDSPISCALAF